MNKELLGEICVDQTIDSYKHISATKGEKVHGCINNQYNISWVDIGCCLKVTYNLYFLNHIEINGSIVR